VSAIETETLIDGVRRRDENTFQELFQTYAKLLWTIASGVLSSSTGAEQDIEECVSDAFIELWNHPEKYDPSRGSIKSYLCIITKNKAIDVWRRKNKEKIISLQDFMENQVEDDYSDFTEYGELYEAIRGLPEPTREIVIRRFFHDEKPGSIAKRLGLPKKEVENRLYRGKRELFESLSDKEVK